MFSIIQKVYWALSQEIIEEEVKNIKDKWDNYYKFNSLQFFL